MSKTVKAKCVEEIKSLILYGYPDFVDLYGGVSKSIDIKCGVNVTAPIFNSTSIKSTVEVVHNDISNVYNGTSGAIKNKFEKSIKNKRKRIEYQKRYRKYIEFALQGCKSVGNVNSEDIRNGLNSFLKGLFS